MKATELLIQQFKDAHEGMEMTIEDVTEEVANYRGTKKAMPVGAAYAHAVLSEDMVLHSIILHEKLLAEGEDVGLSEPSPSMEDPDVYQKWYTSVSVDLLKMRAFAKKVYQATDEYLVTLKEADLDSLLEVPGMGKKTLGYLLNNWLLLHFAALNGEVSAAKGFQDKKGYPW